MAKGGVSFEQWCYELQSLRKTYSDAGLRKGTQRCLGGAAADTVNSLGPDVSFDVTIKKFNIIYRSAKSFDLLKGTFIGQNRRGGISTIFCKQNRRHFI